MAARIRAHEWAETPLGPIWSWPQSLRTVVDIMLSSPSMMSLVWGPEALHLYNDGFTELLREHRVEALGKPVFETFARSSEAFAADVAAGMSGQSARLLEQRYPVLRNDRLEDAWFDVEYVPVRDEAGQVSGVLWTLKETTAQVLTTRALREREARHRLLIESWAQAEWETDAAGVVVTDSPSWRAYTGQTLKEWLGYGWLDAIHPDDRAYAERQWREAVAARGLVNAEFRLRAPDGGWRWTNFRAAPVLDAQGRIEKWAGMNIDIDARKRAERTLREREADLARVQRIGGVGGLDIDIAGGMQSWRSPEYLRLHGLSPDHQHESHADWRDRVHPEDRDAAEAVLFEALAGGDRYEAEYRILRTSDGEERWIQARADIERDETGKAVRLVGAHLDVTDQKRAQSALEDAQGQLRGVLDSISDGFARFDAAFTIRDVNAATLRMDGRRRDELIGRSHWAAFPGTEDSDLGTLYRQVARERVPGSLEHFYAWPDGRGMWVDVRAYPTPDGGIAVFWRDIADRKMAADALRESEERYRQLFTSMDEAYAVVDVLKDEGGAWVDFRFVEVNPAFIAHTSMPWPVGKTATELLGEPNPRWTELYGQALDTGKPIRVEEGEPTLDRVFDLNIFALDPKRNRVAVLFTNITGRKRAEVALRESEERLRLALEVGRLAAWDWNLATGDVQWSDEHYRMQGYPVGAVTPSYEAWAARVHPDDLAETQEALRAARDGSGVYAHEFRSLHPHGTVRWLSAHGRFFRDELGTPARMVGAMIDVTEQREWGERQKVLLAELQHRVRNILAVVRSIVSRSNDGERSAEDYAQHLQGRLSALARTQVLLTRRAGSGVDLEEVIRDELVAQAVSERQFTLHGPDIELSPKAAEVLTLAIHELATNATKYGAFSRESGRLTVEWKIEVRGEQRWLILVWVERGVPVIDAAPRRQGFGSELISRRIPYELRGLGSFELKPGGLESHIAFPLRAGDTILQTSGVE